MISVQEFLIRARLEHGSLEAWIAAGWLVPPQTEPELMFSDIDLARAQLIRDLHEDFGVNVSPARRTRRSRCGHARFWCEPTAAGSPWLIARRRSSPRRTAARSPHR